MPREPSRNSQNADELDPPEQIHEERMCKLSDDGAHRRNDADYIIERVFHGRGIHKGKVRAKILGGGRPRYVNFHDLIVW